MIWFATYVLIELHGPGGQTFDINVAEVVELRTPRDEDHFARGVQCIVNTSDGKYSAVSEDCDTVRRMIEGEPR